MDASSLSPRYWAISAVHCLRGGGIEGRLFVLGEFLKVTHTIGAHSIIPWLESSYGILRTTQDEISLDLVICNLKVK